MDIGTLGTLGLYSLSTVAYIAYLFVQKKALQRYGLWLLSAGFIVHTLSIGYRAFTTGHLPVNTLRDTLSFAGWALAGVFLLFHYRYRLKILGIFAAPLATAVMVVVASMPATTMAAKPMFKSFWLISHVTFIFIGEASLALACGLGVLYLTQEKAIKSKKPGFFFRRLPSLDQLDSAGYSCILGGFLMMTLGLILGVVYAKAVWGRFWSWDPKEVWSGITWLLYAGMIHMRLSVGWRGRRSAIMAILGFATVMFTFLGVNLLLSGHHGEFTR
ncbi:MAG: c-type cytochrome biogenesis protein CcsB [Desulfobacterales bacterium]